MDRDDVAWLARIMQSCPISEEERVQRVKAQVAALQRAPPPPHARHVQNMCYGSGMGYANYMEPPPQQWGHTYHPYDRNHHNLSWTNPNGGTDAPDYLPQPPYQAPIEPPPQEAPRLKSMAELYKEYYGYDYVPPTDEERMQRSGIHYQDPSHDLFVQSRSYSDMGAYPLQQHQAPRVEPPQQDPYLVNLNLKEEMDRMAKEIAELKVKLKVKMAEHAEKIEADASLMPMLPNETQSPSEQEKAIATDPPSPSHERAEATKATEEELSEEIIEQCHEHVPTPSDTDIAQSHHVDVSSSGESDKLIEQIIHEIELLSGVEKAQELGRRQERQAATRKTPGGSKSGPSGRYKARHVKMKESRATSRKIKPSTPRNTTRVKMKASSGVDELKEIDSGQCVPKMAYYKNIDRKHLFPPPFIP